MNRRIWLGTAALVFALSPAAVLADDKPDFTGEWKLNVDKSDFGPTPMKPDKLILKVDHKDPNITINQTIATPQGERSSDQNFVIDGKEQTRSTPQGDVKFTPKWDGQTFVVEQTRTIQGNDIKVLEKWVLSKDKKVLNISRDVTAPMGQFSTKMVMEKQ